MRHPTAYLFYPNKNTPDEVGARALDHEAGRACARANEAAAVGGDRVRVIRSTNRHVGGMWIGRRVAGQGSTLAHVAVDPALPLASRRR